MASNFICMDCRKPTPTTKKCQDWSSDRGRCPQCETDRHARLYAEVDDIASGRAKARAIRYDAKAPAEHVETVAAIVDEEQALGATRDAAVRLVADMMPKRLAAKIPNLPKRGLAAGGGRVVARWTRPHKGADVVVDVLEGGSFRWAGKVYPNQSSVAEAIVGYHVSGPAFFKKATVQQVAA